MADVKFACPGCQLHIKVGVEYVGMASTCPECQQQFKIPAPPGEVKFACGGCQLRLALHESYIGSQITCPNCQAQVIVPNPAAPAAPAAPKPAPAKPAAVPAKPKAVSAADRVGSPPAARPAAAPRPAAAAPAAKGGGPTTRPPNVCAPPNVGAPPSGPASPAAPVAVAAAAPQAPAASGACPSCGAAMEADAIICTSCGYNTETGEEMASEVEAAPPPPPGSKKKKKKKPQKASAVDEETALCKKLLWLPPAVFGVLFLGGFIHPFIFLGAGGLYLIAAFVVGIWSLVAAFQDGLIHGLLMLFGNAFVGGLYGIIYVYFINDRRPLKAAYTGILLTIPVMFAAAAILGQSPLPSGN